MMFKTTTVLSLLISLMLLASCWGCSNGVDDDVASAAESIVPPSSGPSGPSDPDDDTNLFSASETQALRRAIAFLDRYPLDTQPPIDDLPELERYLGRRLERTPNDERFSRGFSNSGQRASTSHQAPARYAQAVIDAAGERLRNASQSEAILLGLRAESELVVVQKDLLRLSENDAPIPRDPLALASDETLREHQKGWQARRRRLAEATSAFDTPENRRSLEFVQSRLDRVEGILASPQRAQQIKDVKTVLGSVDAEDWKRAAADRPTRARAEFARLRRATEASLPYLALHSGGNKSTRGPPRSLDRVVLSAVRDYDTDVASWARSEAALRDFGQKSREASVLGEIAKERGWRAVSVAAVSDRTLDEMDRLTRHVRRQLEMIETGPSGPIEKGRLLHLESWQKAIARELTQRRGNNNLNVSENLTDLVKPYLRATEGVLPTTAESKFLALSQERFRVARNMPPVLRDEGSRFVAKAVARYDSAAVAMFESLRTFDNTLAASSESVPRTTRGTRANLSKHIRALLVAADDYSRRATSVGYSEAPRSPAARLAKLYTGPRGPPPAAEISVSAAPKSQPPSGGVVLTTDPRAEGELIRAEKALARARSLEKTLEAQVKTIDTSVRAIGTQRGRRVVDSASFKKGTVAWRQIARTSETRLPERLSDWAGRLDDSGKPYHYDAVRRFNHFKYVGGGIHFGAVARLSTPKDLSEFVLRYDIEHHRFELIGPSGALFSTDRVAPQTAKALLRFVRAERNAAISIGWADTVVSGVDALQRDASQPVLLDPYLVDTVVGQDLILADKIPWDLDEPTLPNGRENPCYAAFAAAIDEWSEESKTAFASVFEGVTASRDPRHVLSPLDHEDPPWVPIVHSLLESDTLPAAKDSIDLQEVARRRSLRAGDAEEFNLSRADSLDTITRKIARRLIIDQAVTEGVSEAQVIGFLETTDGESALEEYESETLGHILEETKAFVARVLEDAPQEPVAAAQSLLRLFAIGSCEEGACDGDVLRAYAAVALSDESFTHVAGDPRVALSSLTAALVNPTTLAVLLDESPSISLRDSRIEVDGKMRYRYATSFLNVDGSEIGIGRDPNDPDNQVRTLDDLTQIANDSLDELGERYQPLGRVMHYARIAAFLRWADQAERNDRLGAIDLSSLAGVTPNDPVRTPTADAITSEPRTSR